MNTTTTAVRRYPQRPERTVPVMMEKEIKTSQAIELLNRIITDARNEIRKRESVILLGQKNETDINALSFVASSFSLTIDYNGGTGQ